MAKRIVFVAPEVVELQDYTPNKIGNDEVMIENIYSVLSAGTERANIMNLPNTVNDFPMVPGYCAVGTVTQLGANVTNVKVGNRVIVYHGKHCTHTVMKAEKLVVVPDTVKDEDAVFTVIASMGLQGLRKCRPEIGESVAVIGLGLLGMFSIQCARLAGCYPVIAVDLNDERLTLAKQLGADFAFRADSPTLTENVKAITHGAKCNMVIEVTGAAKALIEALNIVAPMGRVSLLGCTRISDCNIDLYQKVHRPGVSLIGAHNWARPLHESSPFYWTREDDYRVLLDFMAAGRLQVAPLRTAIVSPEKAPEYYQRLIKDPTAPLGIVFDWKQVR